MRTTKIVLIGAGSASFGLGTLLDIIAHTEALRGSTVVLNDIDPEALNLMLAVARGLNEQAGAGLVFEGSEDQRAALDGAEFVITSVEVGRLSAWQQDWIIPLKHGVKQVLGENGGPGGLSHTLRVAYLMLQVARNIQEVTPNAWVLNFTNPMSRVCLALRRYTDLKVVGLCHQIGEGYRIVGRTLGMLSDTADAAGRRREMVRLYQKLDIKSAGLNHFTFIYDIRDNESGADLYPEFHARLAAMPADFEPLSRRLLDAYGLFPATGDGHAGEYVPFAWETSTMQGYDFARARRHSEEVKSRLRDVVADPTAYREYVGWISGERAIPIVNAILHNKNQYEVALNIPNRGCIPDLPDWAIVEIPGVVSGEGVRGLSVPHLGAGITAILAQQVAIQDRAVEAAVHGDRQSALQALLLDPVISSYEAAVAILDELLAVHAAHLPQFNVRT